MELKDTIELMTSDDYRERFKAEVYQLKIRYKKLRKMLDKWQAGKLGFEPACSYNLLFEQCIYMEHLINALVRRSWAEGIELEVIPWED